MASIRILYHLIDYDGKGSAALLKHQFPDATLHPYDYHFPVDETEFEPGDTLFIVDFSFKPQILVDLARRYKVVWIDHHKSALEAWDKFVREDASDEENAIIEQIHGVRDRNRAAVEIVWDWLNLPLNQAETPPADIEGMRPYVIRLLGKFDRWQRHDPDWRAAELLNYGLQAYEDDPDQPIWEDLLRTGADTSQLETILKEGERIQAYLERDYAAYVGSTTFEHTMPDPATGRPIRFLVCNRGRSLSLVLDSIYDPEKHDAVAFYAWRPKQQAWRFSLFANTPKAGVFYDLSAIAKRFGGGGHAEAAGCFVQYLGDFFGDNPQAPRTHRPDPAPTRWQSLKHALFGVRS